MNNKPTNIVFPKVINTLKYSQKSRYREVYTYTCIYALICIHAYLPMYAYLYINRCKLTLCRDASWEIWIPTSGTKSLRKLPDRCNRKPLIN